MGRQKVISLGLTLTLFVVCLPLHFMVAQQASLVIPTNDLGLFSTIENCDSTISFISDTANHTLYVDTIPRSDTMSICPPSQGQRVVVQFDAFDLATGDSLFVFNGKIPDTSIFVGSGTGVGVAQAFGGWVKADCFPEVNLSGCLSFVFKTNGDSQVSAGWESSVSCESRDIQIRPPDIPSSILDCQNSYVITTIPAASVSATCGNESDIVLNDTTFVRVLNSFGEICIDTCLTFNHNGMVTDTFAIGTYLVQYKLKADSSVQGQTSFSVIPKTLACNDTLNIGMDNDCSIRITPDLILESFCDTLSDTLHYEISILAYDEKNPNGLIIASGTGIAGDYPIVSKDMVDFCGNTVYRVKVKRIYYQNLDLSFCNDGTQSNTCWSHVRFEDKTPPIFGIPIQCDTIYACDIEMTAEALGLDIPVTIENCDATQVVFVGATRLNIPTDCDTLERHLVLWQATDGCGNIGQRADTVKIVRPGIDKVVKVPDVILSCGEDDTIMIEDLVRLGMPSLQIGRKKNGIFIPNDTISLIENANVCQYNLGKIDTRVEVECSDKYFRHWQLLDWCSNSTNPINIDTQLIEFRDTLAPTIICTDFNVLSIAEHIPLPADDCRMEVSFPLPTATDNCVIPKVAEYTVDVLEEGTWWTLADNLAQAGKLECDTFRVGYRAFDDCKGQIKEDSCFRYFIIEDKTSPVALCEDKLNISIVRDTVHVHADAIDGGSYDMCEIDTILARRTLCNDVSTYQGVDNQYIEDKFSHQLDPRGWSDILTFTCCDAHHPVFIELLVIDKKGNFNTCWMEMTVEDKIPPICNPLPPVTAFCDEYNSSELGSSSDINGNGQFDNNEWQPLLGTLEEFYNQSFGNPDTVCIDNLTCNNPMLEQEYQLITQSCGEVNIKRRYRVIDYGKNNSNWVEQTINLEYRPNWKIIFPEDQAGDCEARLEAPTESPILNGNCDQLSWDYEDEIFETTNSVFVKILRTYSIVNWCIYEPGQAPLVITRPENTKGLVETPFMVSSDSLANAGFIQYTQVLRVIDEESPFLILGKIDTVLIGKGDVPPLGEEDQTLGDFPLECDDVRIFQVFARDCDEEGTEGLSYEWEFYLDNEMMASGIGDTFSQIVFPGPNYEVKWFVTDVFSNTSLIGEFYTFVDGIAPIAYCNSGLVAEATPGNRFVYINASMLDRGSFDNCTDQINLKRRLWHPVLNIPRPQTAMEVMNLPETLEFGCLFIGTQEVSLYIMDEAGNFAYCTTNVIIQNNMLACSRRIVSGQILDQNNQPVEQVGVVVESQDNNLTLSSDTEGNFEFTMPDGADYTIRPILDSQPLNGVSTYDLVLISQHILGTKTFDSPYQYIAADANQSGTVTAFDIVQIRQLILNIIPTFPNNTSWRFVDMDYEFPTIESAMQLISENEEKSIRNLSGDRLGMDFLGIKIGDINGSAVPNRSTRAMGRSYRKKFALTIDNQEVERNQIYTIPFYANDLERIMGYQFTLQFKQLRLLHIEGGVASLEHFGRQKETEGILTTSWHSLQSHANSSPLFTLTFQATANGNLSELLHITSDHTPAEAYGFGGTFFDVDLNFKHPIPIPFRVYQNTPNPFQHQTTVGFDLPANGRVAVQVVNMQGQVVFQYENDFTRGLNEINLPLKNLPPATYYYQLATSFGLESRKMTKVQ